MAEASAVESSGPTRPCANCKKEIPEVNFIIHNAHCQRYLKICPRCKEPVSKSEMAKHNAQAACAQCGEKMYACDIQAHISDACSMTQVQCSYCELMLNRVKMSDHEIYCGTRTERCTECSELVMFKYQKLHEESNHTFLKLEDEPGPEASWKTTAYKSDLSAVNNLNSNFNEIKYHNQDYYTKFESPELPNNFKYSISPFTDNGHDRKKDAKKTSKATPSRSTHVHEVPSEYSQISNSSRGAIKKRIAPQPPVNQVAHVETPAENALSSSFKHIRDVPMYNALLREQAQIKEREIENLKRLENNLPPILTAAEKVDKLYKMSALQNMDFSDDNYTKSKEKSTIWNSSQNTSMTKKENNELTHQNENQLSNIIPSTSKNVNMKTDKNNKKKIEHLEYSKELNCFTPIYTSGSDHKVNGLVNTNTVPSSKTVRKVTINENDGLKRTKQKVAFQGNISSNPPNTDNNKFNISNKKIDDKQLPSTNGSFSNAQYPHDRFSDIKNSLTALRKEFKNCTSPLETRKIKDEKNNAQAYVPENEDFREPHDPLKLFRISGAIQQESTPMNADDDLRNILIPCEFCEIMVEACDLVSHETGCRPHITSLAKSSNSNPNPQSTTNVHYEHTAPPNTPDGYHAPKNRAEEGSSGDELDEVKLPCEFCMDLIPASRLQWHQEMCFT